MTDRPSWAPTAEDLIEVNKQVTQPQYGGGSPGVHYEIGLYPALARPWGRYFGKELFPTPYEKAAALMEEIIRSHVFTDGTKRTAFVAGVTLLQLLTGKEIRSTTEEEVELTLAIENKCMGVAEIASWLEAHSI